MNNSYKDTIESIRSEVSVEEVASRLGIHIENKTSGKVALCPFHDDKHPSLRIYDEKKPSHYHCYSCDAHGDVFKLVMIVKGYSFKESLNWMCEEFNYSISNSGPSEIKAWSNPFKFGFDHIRSNSAQFKLSEWSKERKINSKVLKNADVLYMPKNALFKGKDKLPNFGYSRDELGLLEDAGLVNMSKVKNVNEKTYLEVDINPKLTFWYSHVLFTIRNYDGVITGFAAREDEEESKYHIPKYRYTKGFKRTDNLFRIDNVFSNAHKYIKETRTMKGLDRRFDLYIVEGFMDALRLESLGYNAVSILGSNIAGKEDIPDGQWLIIKKLSEILGEIPLCIHLFLDNDAAGRKGNSTAIEKLPNFKNSYANNVFYDVIQYDTKLKDPDDILQNTPAYDLLKDSAISPIDFYILFSLEASVDELKEKFDNLAAIQKSQLFTKIRNNFNIKDQTLFVNSYNISGLVHYDSIPSPITITKTGEDVGTLNLADIHKAIRQCEVGYTGVDFPIDYKSWDRLQKGHALLTEEFQKLLSEGNNDEYYIGVLTPRQNSNDEPRLKVLPSPELLVMQEYVLSVILKHALSTSKGEPECAIFHSNKPWNSSNGNTNVSFAYQVDKDNLLQSGKYDAPLFRHFSKCWNDFNGYILNRVRKAPEGFTLYPARLDIRRYYDNIPQYAVGNSLNELLPSGLTIPGLGSDKTNIINWIFSVTFGYKYYLPNGKKTTWDKPDVGIPQGPNLSAWLATIVLFSVDKAMTKLVEDINVKHRLQNNLSENDATVFATYARYVDDIILIAPNTQILSSLQHHFSNEISKIGLMLSPKTDPMEPQLKEDMEAWLLKDRGLFQNSLGEWIAPEKMADSGLVERLNWMSSLDRRQALSLLHNDNVTLKFDSQQIRKVIKNVCNKADELKDRDWRYISARLWKIAFDEEEALDDNTKKIAKAYFNEWIQISSANSKGPNFDIEITEEIKGLSSFTVPLKIIWPFLVALEGLQITLLTRYDKRLSIPDDDRLVYDDYRKKVAKLILTDLLNTLEYEFSNTYKIPKESFDDFKLVIQLRQMVLKQQALLTINDPDEYKKHLSESINISLIPFQNQELRRYMMAAMPYNTYNGISISNEFVLFHDMVNRLDLLNYNTVDRTNELLNNINLSKSNKLRQSLACLCSEFGEDSNFKIEPTNKYESLQVFANIVTNIKCQFNALKNRASLIHEICGKDTDTKSFILPQPSSIKPLFIKVLSFVDKSKDYKISQIKLINEKRDDLDFMECINESLPESIRDKKWKPLQQEHLDGIECHFANVSEYNYQFMLPSCKNLNDPTDKIKCVRNIYNSLSSIAKDNDEFNGYILNPFNIVKVRDNDYNIISIKHNDSIEQDIIKTKGFGSSSHSDLHEFDISPNFSYLWRIGFAISGLLDLSQQFVRNDLTKLQSHTLGTNPDDAVSDSFLRQSMFILCGQKWWSNPHGHGELPWSVKNTLEQLDNFITASDLRNKIGIWLSINFKTKLITTISEYKEVFKKQGAFALVYSKVAYSLIPNHEWLLTELLKNIETASISTENFKKLPRSIEGQIRHIEILERYNITHNDIDDLIVSQKIRVIVSVAKMLALFQISIIKPSAKSFIDNYDFKEVELDEHNLLSSRFAGTDIKSFIDQVLKNLANEPFDCNLIDSIYPLGWHILAIELMKINFPKQISKIDGFSEKTRPVFLWTYEIKDEWPFANDIKILSNQVDECYSQAISFMSEDFFGVDNGFRIKFETVEKISNPLIGDDVFSSSKGDRSVSPWEITFEKFAEERSFHVESKKYSDKKIKYTFSEIWYKDELIHASILSNGFANFINGFTSEESIPEESIPEEPTPEEPTPEEPTPEELIENFRTAQRKYWNKRTERTGRHIRVAFLQYNVEESYSHPLKDICKSKEAIVPEPNKHTDLIKLPSCAEFRRRKILEETIQCCTKFDVDILLLSEYSVRPDTINHLLQFTKKEKIKNLAIWCGTYRQPYWEQTTDVKGDEEIHIPVRPMMSPLFVIQNGKVLGMRGKKYPAVAMGEMFSPNTELLDPIYQHDIKNPTIQPGEYATELICSECFCMTSPVNRNAINLETKKLITLFKEDNKVTEANIDNDLNNISNWMSHGNLDQKPISNRKPSDWLKFHPRKTILLLPTMTTRSVDYHYLGIANYLAAGICTVFCNTTKNSYGYGGSCFIGNGSYDKEKKNPYFSKRSGPYNNVFPGIFKQGTLNDGALGENDQAIVICDIDPEYQSEGRPRQQMLPSPLSLVAHIPILEYTSIKKDLNGKKTKCSCGKHARIFIDNKSDTSHWLSEILKIINRDNDASDRQHLNLKHLQKESIIKTFKKVVPIFEKNDSWFKERAIGYEHGSMIFPSNQPPAALYDFILVDTILHNSEELPKIEVPPYRMEFDTLDGIDK